MGNSRKKEKKTAVDWFAGEVDKLVTDLQRGKIQPSEYLIGFFKLRDKAKKKERKQIKDAYDVGLITPFDYDWEIIYLEKRFLLLKAAWVLYSVNVFLVFRSPCIAI